MIDVVDIDPTLPVVKNLLLLDSEGKRIAVNYYSSEWWVHGVGVQRTRLSDAGILCHVAREEVRGVCGGVCGVELSSGCPGARFRHIPAAEVFTGFPARSHGCCAGPRSHSRQTTRGRCIARLCVPMQGAKVCGCGCGDGTSMGTERCSATLRHASSVIRPSPSGSLHSGDHYV